jgi:hypothetical protein
METPVEGVILEIKFTDRFPSWASDIAEMFQLRQSSVPKYVMSLDRALGGARAHIQSFAGIAQPRKGYQEVTDVRHAIPGRGKVKHD